jgi:protoporphyrinogen oxidase
MMWERICERIRDMGSNVVLNSPVQTIHWRADGVAAVRTDDACYEADHFVSSIAMRELVESLDPPPPARVMEAAQRLKYRDFLTVALVLRRRNVFPDNWIYIHDPNVKMGRIQNYRNWSPEMVPDPETTCLGLEYFCQEGDELWSAPDDKLIEFGKTELEKLALADSSQVTDGAVVRMPKAYPVYDRDYQSAVAEIRNFVEGIPNLQLVGRNGMHRYNNQDHSMLTGMLAARKILGADFDLWQVNVDGEYLEEGREITLEEIKAMQATQPLIPRRLGESG